MGNCFKKKFFVDSYLMDPLVDNTDNYVESENIHNLKNIFNEQYNILKQEIINLNMKIKLLEENTQNNLKLLSNDIHFINKHVNYNNTSLSVYEDLKNSDISNADIFLPEAQARICDLTDSDKINIGLDINNNELNESEHVNELNDSEHVN